MRLPRVVELKRRLKDELGRTLGTDTWYLHGMNCTRGSEVLYGEHLSVYVPKHFFTVDGKKIPNVKPSRARMKRAGEWVDRLYGEVKKVVLKALDVEFQSEPCWEFVVLLKEEEE